MPIVPVVTVEWAVSAATDGSDLRNCAAYLRHDTSIGWYRKQSVAHGRGAKAVPKDPRDTRAAYKMRKLYRFSPNTYNTECINITR